MGLHLVDVVLDWTAGNLLRLLVPVPKTRIKTVNPTDGYDNHSNATHLLYPKPLHHPLYQHHYYSLDPTAAQTTVE